MEVRELIEKLWVLNPRAEVKVVTDEQVFYPIELISGSRENDVVLLHISVEEG